MCAFSIGLRALRHPLTLFSIALLLFNDHVLKAAAPSTLTGKLSDFAGLFFFPLLLTALLGLLLDRVSLPPRRTAALGFSLTLLWFALIKTAPAANALTAGLAARILGSPVTIALDPTDLLALVVVWPAWRLWRRVEASPQPHKPLRREYLALGLAALATLATAPCPPQGSIKQLAVVDGMIFTRGYDFAGWSGEAIYASADGLTWQPVEGDAPPQAVNQLSESASLPVTLCEPDRPSTCYRISGSEQVEVSTDGGNTWQVAWRIPWGRREFMDRFQSGILLNCKGKPDRGPYALALLPQPGGVTLVAAMGNEGVLSRTPDGQWQRLAVGSAGPTPFSGTQGSNLWLMLFGETALLLAAALLVWIVFSLWGAGAILKKASLPEDRSHRWVLAPAWWGVAVLVGSVAVVSVLFLGRLNEVILLLALLAAAVGVIAGPLVTWKRLEQATSQSDLARRARRASWLTILGLFPLAWLPFPAWVYALVPAYLLALFISLAVGVLSLWWGVRQVNGIARQMAALGPLEPAPRSAWAPEVTAALPTPRWAWGLIVVLLALAAAFASPYASIFYLIWGAVGGTAGPSIWFWLQPSFGRWAVNFILLGALGLAGYRLTQRASLPGLMGERMVMINQWAKLLFGGAALGAAIGIVRMLMVGGGGLSGGQYLYGLFWLAGLSNAVAEEVIFRFFLLSAVTCGFQSRRERGTALQAALWISTIVSAAVLLPWYNLPYQGAISFYVILLPAMLVINYLAGRIFIRHGLAGSVCFNLGVSLAIRLVAPGWF